MQTIAEYLAEQLSARGVTRVYGLPGGENVVMLEAIRKRGIGFTLVKNESSACFMAAAEARLTGGLGVALTTLGPGASNACAGLAHAWLDRAPILLITAAADPADAGRHSHQAIDLNALFKPICKLTVELKHENAARIIGQALSSLRTGRPGPAHLSLHNSIAALPIDAQDHARHAASKPAPANELLDQARRLLADASKPIILVGLGMEPEASYAQLRQLAESLGAPLIETPKSKGALPADHVLFAGTIGLTRADPVYALVDEADFILAIGFDVVELVKPWDYQKPLIWIANWANHDPRIPADVELVGHIGEILAGLGQLESSSSLGWGAHRIRQFRASQANIPLPMPQKKRILPQTFLESLRAHTPADTIVTTDVGSHKIFTALHWLARKPNRYLVSNGLSAMGFGLCSAIAAAEVSGQPTICITGDAGLAMVLGELGIMAEMRLQALVFVMNDGALDLIRSAQLRHGKPAFGTEFSNPDYASIARAYALDYYVVESRRECDRAIRAALANRVPALIDVMIDPIGYPTTPINRTS